MPEDFSRYRAELTKTRGHVSVGNEVQRVRTLFKWCDDAEFLDRPVRFGPEFKKPSRRLVRKKAQSKGRKLLTQWEILALLEHLGIFLFGRQPIFAAVRLQFGLSQITPDLAGRDGGDDPTVNHFVCQFTMSPAINGASR